MRIPINEKFQYNAPGLGDYCWHRYPGVLDFEGLFIREQRDNCADEYAQAQPYQCTGEHIQAKRDQRADEHAQAKCDQRAGEYT